MVKNLDNAGKFLMYPRFVQVFLDEQLEVMSNHKRIYVTPSHTKKIFRNIRRVGKGFSGRDTPLFPTMMVQAQQEHDEAVNEEMDDSLVRAATTASSLEAEQDSGNIDKTQSKATLNEPNPQGTGSGSGPRRQETMREYNALARVLDLENDYKFETRSQEVREERRVKNSQAQILSGCRSATKITLVHETQGRYGDEEMFDTGVLDGDEVLAEPEVTIKDVNLSVDEVTLAQALAALKSAKV
ncbi:hypothetical protein Tco_1202468 [Tanacetum coccineum]